MFKKPNRNVVRKNKHKRIRVKLSGTEEIPRLCVFKSINHIYAQIIDDQKNVTLVAVSTLDKELKDLPSKSNVQAAQSVGSQLAKKAQEQGITTVIFDRAGYKYHGKVAALADAAREGGLQF
ncbi:MAG TPA: 50S ribosomal protein L18 [Syntrophomonadaceae bacterium]|nr:50S ribosomal protein L18 [Syntrophomonadaceae bacterium]